MNWMVLAPYPGGGEISYTCPTSPGAHPASCTMGIVPFPGVKWPGCGTDHPPPPSMEVKEKSREIPLLPLRAFMACSTVNFTFVSLVFCEPHKNMFQTKFVVLNKTYILYQFYKNYYIISYFRKNGYV
jgi:hypothetical protein